MGNQTFVATGWLFRSSSLSKPSRGSNKLGFGVSGYFFEVDFFGPFFDTCKSEPVISRLTQCIISVPKVYPMTQIPKIMATTPPSSKKTSRKTRLVNFVPIGFRLSSSTVSFSEMSILKT